MKSSNCSLWILGARTDVSFMMQTIPHIIKMCNFPFEEKVLAVDTALLSGDKTQRPGIGTMEQLRKNCKKLLDKKIVDKVIDINYSKEYKDKVYLKHFGTKRIKQTHNWKGYPVLGSIFCIEECKSEYMLHFDSDILFYQNKNYNWIKEGIELTEKYPNITDVRPFAGPPTKEGKLGQDFEYNPNGFYKIKGFSSRCFLINCKKFEKLLPMNPLYYFFKKRRFVTRIKHIINYLRGDGFLESWENIVANKIKKTNYFRAILDSTNVWTLHPCDHGPKFIEILPKIIKKIEKGEYPEEQAGDYDLKLEYWI